MNLEHAISKLLYMHDCVIVPGFGGFVTKNVPAYISNATQMFVPPSKKISFNVKLSENDGLLATYIAKQLQCEYSEALEAIKGTVDLWKETLNEDNPLKIDQIGRFYYDKEKNLQFKPKLDANFELATFGLPVFRAPILESESAIQRMNRTAVPPKSIQSKDWSWLRIAAVIIPVLGLLTLGTLKTDRYQNADFTFSGLWSSLTLFSNDVVLDSNAAPAIEEAAIHTGIDSEFEASEANTATVAADSFEENTLSSDEIILDNPSNNINESLPELKTATQLPFQVVVGSFSNRENAQKFVHELQVKGANAFILDSPGLVKVSCGGYTNREAASQAAQSVKNTLAPGAWIFKI